MQGTFGFVTEYIRSVQDQMEILRDPSGFALDVFGIILKSFWDFLNRLRIVSEFFGIVLV